MGSVVNQNICEHMLARVPDTHIHAEIKGKIKKRNKQKTLGIGRVQVRINAQTRMKCKTKCADENHVKTQAELKEQQNKQQPTVVANEK